MTEQRPFDIEGIPATIQRETVEAFIESLGIKLKRLVALRIHWKAIEVELLAENADGQLYRADGNSTEPAMHHIMIPVVD